MRVKEYQEAKLTNWMTPLLWSIISRAALRAGPGMRPAEIVKECRKIDTVLFAKLAPQTVGAWIDRSGERAVWSSKTLERVEKGNKPGGTTTRVGVLVRKSSSQSGQLTHHWQIDYPDTTKTILEHLHGLRNSQVALTLTTIRSIIIARLQHSSPKIFTTPSPDGTTFRCSEHFVKKFIKRALGWTMRQATRAGRKIPPNYESILQKSHARIAWVIKHWDIHSKLIVNSDQTQMALAQGCHMTYAPKNSTQVSVIGSEEKRAITVLVSVTNDGVLLPYQSIHSGMTARSLPASDCPCMKESLDAGHLFESSMTKTYWSTPKTMQNFVNRTLAPYFDAVKAELGLPADQHSIWLIDCWSVHRSRKFQSWIFQNHPTIIVIFVPAGLTGLWQPCDVGIQKAFKHSLKQSCHNDIVQEVLDQLTAGAVADNVFVDAAVGVLRDRTVGWLWKSHEKLNKPEIIKKVRLLQTSVEPTVDIIHRHGNAVALVTSTSLMRVLQVPTRAAVFESSTIQTQHFWQSFSNPAHRHLRIHQTSPLRRALRRTWRRHPLTMPGMTVRFHWVFYMMPGQTAKGDMSLMTKPVV